MDDVLVTIHPLNFTVSLGVGLVIVLTVFGVAAKIVAVLERRKQHREDKRIRCERLSLYMARGDRTNVAALMVLHPEDFSRPETEALTQWLQDRADHDE